MKIQTSFLFILLLIFPIKSFSQQIIWSESFEVFEKGYWGDGLGGITSDMSGITKWAIDVSACTLADAADYIKTVSTSDGRMQAVDIDGEAIWISENIDITDNRNTNISVNISETGPSTNILKYVKIYYILDAGVETLFEANGENIGNFGSVIASQSGLNGDNLQIVVRINNPNAGDACIFDEILVSNDNEKPLVLSVNAINANTLKVIFSEPLNQGNAENIENYNIEGLGVPNSATLNIDQTSVELNFSSVFVENQPYNLTISGIADLNDNIMDQVTESFVFIEFKVEEIFVSGSNEILVEFSHSLNQISAETASNFSIDNGIGNPSAAILISDTVVRLITSTNFTNNTAYQLNISNLSDENGVVLDGANVAFIFHQVEAFDLVINEILADPTPPVGLPDYEYFELFNRTNYELCLHDWIIKIGTSSKSIPLLNIGANSYLIITSESGIVVFKEFGQTVGILGSSDLTNAGKEIMLENNVGLKIDSVAYTETWYQDAEKENGGWSLERIDPDNLCSTSGNWSASIDFSGGSPGRINSVDAANIDNSAPVLLSILVYESNEIRLTFNEELQSEQVSNINNYLLDGSYVPANAYLVPGEFATVSLILDNILQEGIHQLSISGIKDLCDNTIAQIDTSFTYYRGHAFDVIINELMVDVSPAPGVLPAAKYVELYNRSIYDIDLSGWYLQIGDNSPLTFPAYMFSSGDYLILCASGQTEALSSFGNTLGILSESQLITSNNPLFLYNQQDTLIDYINYSDTWYGNPEKENGGWSLERIDQDNFCGEIQNWSASIDFKGGTPGSVNSLSADNPDDTKPELVSVQILSSHKLALNFSKNISQQTALNPDNYQLDDGSNQPIIINFPDTSRSTIFLQFSGQFIDSQEQTIRIQNLIDFCGNQIDEISGKFSYYLIHPTGVFAETDHILHLIFSEEVEIVSAQIAENYLADNGIGNPTNVYKHSLRKNEVYLEFSTNFINGQRYSVHIENVKDLNGNFIVPVDLEFVYFVPSFNDLVINEILFNPRPTGIDFIEIYNKSGYPVDLSKISLARRDEQGELASIIILSGSNLIYESGHFLAISADSTAIKNEYPAIAFDKFIQISSMPSYNDDEGTVVLLFEDEVIDEISYNQDMHFALITDPEGVSLERVDPEKASNLITNWHSAAESKGFATPANQNSQFRKLSDNMEDEVLIEPETFSPNSDGYDDVSFIRYKFNEPGFVANVSIYDGKGRLIKRIASNELLAVEGEFSWDGLQENQSKANIGIYIIYFEVFNLQGVVKKYKKVCVVADKLR